MGCNVALSILVGLAGQVADDDPPASLAETQEQLEETESSTPSLALTTVLGAIAGPGIASTALALGGATGALVSSAGASIKNVSMDPRMVLVSDLLMVLGLVLGSSISAVLTVATCSLVAWYWFHEDKSSVLGVSLAGVPLVAGAALGFGVPLALLVAGYALTGGLAFPMITVANVSVSSAFVLMAAGIGAGLLACTAGGAAGAFTAWHLAGGPTEAPGRLASTVDGLTLFGE